MEDVRFSVVIPLYNKGTHVERALRSVQLQPSLVTEIIVVDDGSTDEGPQLVSKMASGDPRIRLIRQRNSGVSVARNVGVSAASNLFILFLDADDEWLDGYVSKIQSLIQSFPHCAIFATAYTLRYADGLLETPNFREVPRNERGGVIERFFRATSEGRSPVCASAVCVRKVAFQEVGGFPAGVSHGEDRVLWGKLALRYEVAWVPFNGAVYHMGTTSQSAQSWSPQRGKVYLQFLDTALSTQNDNGINEWGWVVNDIRCAIVAQHRIALNNSVSRGFYRAAFDELRWLSLNDNKVRLPKYLMRIIVPATVRSFMKRIFCLVKVRYAK